MSEQHWYSWTDPKDGGDYFLVFANVRGSCSMRTYDGSSGRAVRGVIRESGKQYEQVFSDRRRSAHLLARAENETWRPNLQACQDGLPRQVLIILQKRRQRSSGHPVF